MDKYRFPRTAAPLRLPVGGRIVGGDETHAFIEIPHGVEIDPLVEAVLEPMGKAKKARKPEAAEADE